MLIANKIAVVLFAGVTLSGLANVNRQANAGVIDDLGDKLVETVVKSLTKDLGDETLDGKEQQEFKREPALERTAADEQSTRNQVLSECGDRRC